LFAAERRPEAARSNSDWVCGTRGLAAANFSSTSATQSRGSTRATAALEDRRRPARCLRVNNEDFCQ
jgi:hypothetical protein